MSKNWAICIGINGYYSLKSLKYAVQDASAMQAFFEQEKFEQVFYFSDDSPEIDTPQGALRSLPTYANLKRFLREFQASKLSVGDNLWFFFAGHGELHSGHDYLMPIDADPGNVEETALKIDDIAASLRCCGADNTVLLLDACRSEGKRGPVGIGTDEQPGVVIIYACSARQSSYEIDELEHGAFTYALLEGLRLQGANSCATVQRIDQYLQQQVPMLSKRYQKGSQTPYTVVEPLAKNCLILLPERARLEDVQSLKLAAYQAENKTDWDFAQQLWIRVLGASRVDQDAIEGLQRIALKRVGPSVAESVTFATAGSRNVAAPTRAEPKPQQVEIAVEAALADSIEFEVVQVDGQGKITQRRQERTICRQEDLGQGIALDLVPIPGGTFQMGSPEGQGYNDERRQHRVTVSPFLMGRYAVTQAQWQAVSALPKVERDLESDPSSFKGTERPVEKISWDDAVEFCRRLTAYSGREYRLPSEAEWEYGCRAGTTTAFHYGETLTSEIANYNASNTYGSGPKGEYRRETTAVGSFPANAFGLYDMHGNVLEWCQDYWHDSYAGAPSDGSAWIEGEDASGRLLRGGSWGSIPGNCRSAVRYGHARDSRDTVVGFRVVCAASWTLA